jgi:hypothetical protein
LAVEPGVTVSVSEYFRELRRFREFKRLVGRPVVPGKVGVLWSAWGRAMALWYWRREPRYLEEVRALAKRVRDVQKEWMEARRYFKRKIRVPFWRIDVAYQFQKTTHVPPYHFYCEFRKYLFTKTPDKYCYFDEKTGEYKLLPEFQREAEGDLRQIMYASSIISRVRKDLTVAHADWVEALLEIKSFPFPNIEIAPVPKEEVTAPLDTQQYYVRFEEAVREPAKGEYETKEVMSWLAHYRRWLAEATARGIVKFPAAYTRGLRQTSLEDFIRRVKERRGELGGAWE